MRVKKAVDYLSEQYTESQLKIGQVAKFSGLSLRNLNRLFVEELGLGPKEILIRLRLEEAKRILGSEGVSVTEASYKVGYQSLSRFIQAFRGLFGYLPSETKAA